MFIYIYIFIYIYMYIYNIIYSTNHSNTWCPLFFSLPTDSCSLLPRSKICTVLVSSNCIRSILAHINMWPFLNQALYKYIHIYIYIYICIYKYCRVNLLAGKVLALHRCRLRLLCSEGNAEFTPSTITIVRASKSRTGVQVSFMCGTKNARRTSK